MAPVDPRRHRRHPNPRHPLHCAPQPLRTRRRASHKTEGTASWTTVFRPSGTKRPAGPGPVSPPFFLPTRTTPPRGPSRGWRAGTRICSPAPASPGQRGTRSARPSAFSRCCAKPEPRPRSRFRRRDAGGRPGCDRGGRRGRDFGLGRRAADRSGASRCRGRGAGCCRVRQGDEGGDEEVRK